MSIYTWDEEKNGADLDLVVFHSETLLKLLESNVRVNRFSRDILIEGLSILIELRKSDPFFITSNMK